MPTLFRKTTKGLAEIETRAHRLTPRLRGLLILVDGKRDLADLAALVPQQTEALLQELTTQGFIETFEMAAGSASASASALALALASASASVPNAASASAGPSAAPVAPSPSPSNDFEKLRREAVRAFTDIAGPAAETVALRMEKTKSLDELRPVLAQAAQLLASMRGRAAAEAYAAKFPSA